MPLSYRNIIDGGQLSSALGSGDFNLKNSLKKPNKNAAKYIKGYANQTAIEALANSLNVNNATVKQAFGIEEKKLDDYDPYHTQDAKREKFWYDDSGNVNLDAKKIQKHIDEDTDTFKRGLYSEYGYRNSDFWHEDPFIPSFELLFDDTTPFFNGDNDFMTNVSPNCLKYFMQKYEQVDSNGYQDRFSLWVEFKRIFFKIFKNQLSEKEPRNNFYKSYYITKISGLEALNRKFIKYPTNVTNANSSPEGDKITITLNEDVSMIAWYLSELYNNIIYSYKNQRYAFPENLIRFNMDIKINEMRNFQIPKSNNPSSTNVPNDPNYLTEKDIKYVISPKSQIVYTLNDCNFNFFESRNYDNDLEIGGYGASMPTSKTLSFDIYFKSVTRYSNYPLIDNSISLNPWKSSLYTGTEGSMQNYYDTLDQINNSGITSKGYLNQLVGKAAQTVANQALNYMDNLENKLRDIRGSAVNNLLSQFRTLTGINKIEPDNVYNPDFNNRASVANFGKSIASGLLNDLENSARNAANF